MTKLRQLYPCEFSVGTSPLQKIAGLSTGDSMISSSLEDPLVLCLHGWLDNAASFLPVMQHWESTDRLLAIDFVGHGLSSHRPPGAWYYFMEYMADIVALFEQFDLHNVHLVGHSMGGFVAQVVAATIPERISQLTLIEAFGLWVSPEHEWIAQVKQAFAERKKLLEKRPPVYASKERLVKMRAEASHLHEELARYIVERNLTKVQDGYTWTVDPRVRLPSLFRFTAAHAHAVLTAITCPVNVILGNQGTPDIRQALDAWGSKLAHKKIVSLCGGHHVHMEQPQAIVRILSGNT